jgi:hypothetical protein
MAITKSLKNVTGGVDLLRPQMNISYIAAGTVSIIVLMLIWKLGGALFAKGDSLVQGRLTGVPAADYKTALGIV